MRQIVHTLSTISDNAMVLKSFKIIAIGNKLKEESEFMSVGRNADALTEEMRAHCFGLMSTENM